MPALPRVKSKSTGLNRGDALSWVLFGLMILFFLVLKSYSLHWQVSDENVYAYMVWTGLNHSALPYADFFFAHPLLHLLTGIPVFGLMGFNPLSMRVIPVTATVIGAIFLFLLAKKEIGRTGAIATALLYLSAFSLLRASSHWTGINLSVMWMIIGLWALTNRRSSLAGWCMAIGVCTGNYVIPAAIMAGLLSLIRSGEDGSKYIVGFILPWALVQLFSIMLDGQSYVDAVYWYHAHKPVKEGIFRLKSIQVFTENSALFLGTLSGSILAIIDTFVSEHNKSPGKVRNPASAGKYSKISGLRKWLRLRLIENNGTSIALVGSIWVFCYLVFISMLANVFPFYYLLLFPAMALTGGYATARYAHFFFRLGKNINHRDKSFWQTTSVMSLVTIAVIAAFLAMAPLQHKLIPDYIRKADKSMNWSDAPIPSFINNLLHTCCFNDVARAYTDYGTIQELLYHESSYFKKAEELAQYVKNNSTPDQTIFGDASATGLIALLSGRRIQADFVDTNTMRFRSGVTPIEEAIRRIDTKELTFIIVSGSIYRGKNGKATSRYFRFAGLPGFHHWLRQHFHEVYRTHDPNHGWYFILKRNAE